MEICFVHFCILSLLKTTQIVAQRLLTGNPIIVTYLLLETSPKREIISGVKAEINLNKTQILNRPPKVYSTNRNHLTDFLP